MSAILRPVCASSIICIAAFVACQAAGNGSAVDMADTSTDDRTLQRATSDASTQPMSPSLLDTLRLVLRTRNPNIAKVAFIHIQGFGYGREYYGIGWGVRADHNFSGSFDDELFVVARLDSTMTEISHIFEFIPSPRWLDYSFRFEQLTGDSIVVVGRGDSYGDGAQRRAYARATARQR